jgi:hypothetical protein
MKYSLPLIPIGLLLPLAVLASGTASFSPNPVASGSESTVTLTYSGSGGEPDAVFLFNEDGNNVSGNGQSVTSPATWAELDFPVGLPAGTYTALVTAAAGSTEDANCGTGHTLSECESGTGWTPQGYGAEATIVITKAESEPTSTPIANPESPTTGTFLMFFGTFAIATPVGIMIGLLFRAMRGIV